ncbi:hypothetical protein [Streptomyces tuirus]
MTWATSASPAASAPSTPPRSSPVLPARPEAAFTAAGLADRLDWGKDA